MADDRKGGLSSARAVQKLFDAVEEGNPRMVILSLKEVKQQAFINLAPSLLHKAALLGHVKILNLILDLKIEHNANIDSQNAQQLTPLHVVCTEGHLDCATFLLSRGALVNAVDFDNRTPLYFATYEGHLEVIKEVLKNHADVNLARNGGWSPLHEAARFGYFDCMKELIKSGANILCITDDAKWTAGHMAASNGQLECLKYLIDAGIDVDARGGPWQSSTLLHEAAHMGHSTCVEFLLSSGADAFALDGRGELALHLAARQGHVETVELLLMYYNKTGHGNLIDAFPDPPSDRGISRNNCLHSVSYHGHEKCVEILLKYGASHLMNGAEMYPIHIAVKQKNVGCLRVMLAHSTDDIISVSSGNEYNCLQYNCMSTYSMDKKAIACACILLNAGIDAETTPSFDNRLCSLYLATRNGAKELVSLLLINGISPHIQLNLNERLLANPRIAECVKMVQNAIDQPKRLLIISRIAIRRFLQHGSIFNAFKLPIPHFLQHYVFHGHPDADGLCDP